MQRFRNISLVYECDEPTLQRAAALARLNRARLTIVYPVRDIPYGQERLQVGRTLIDLRKLVQQECEAQVKAAAARVRSLGVRPATKVLFGEPSVEVIRDVIQQHRDLVIMTAEGRGGLKERLFGSSSSHLMRKCPAPLFVMKPKRGERFTRILAAVDPDQPGSARNSLNDTIVELAASLAAREAAELHVVHAWTLFGESVLRGRGRVTAAEVQRVAQQEGKRRRQLVADVLAAHRITNCELHVMKGEPSAVITQFVRSRNIDLLVMGTVCRSGIPGFIIGNTAERVLDTVDCSVLVVKPAGFVSPVLPDALES